MIRNLAFMAMLSAGFASFGAARPEAKATEVYSKVSGSLAIVKGSRGAGSGFVLRTDGATWLYTNEHVLRCGGPIRAYFVDGKPIRIEGEVEVAENRDVARAKIAEGTPALTPCAEAPTLDQAVFVFGNSDGGGVLTKLVGKVLGTGNDRIEVSAKFVQGNSGSAILDEKGEVLGIATQASIRTDAEDWVKADSRFNSVRRYGERLGGIVWKRVDWDEYEQARRALDAFDEYRKFLVPICFKSHRFNTGYDVGDFAGAKTVSALDSALAALAKQDRKLDKAYADMAALMEKRKTLQPGSMQYPKKENVNVRYRKLKREQEASAAARVAAFRKAAAAVKTLSWPCSRMKRDAEDLKKGFLGCAEMYEGHPQDSLSDFHWQEK